MKGDSVLRYCTVARGLARPQVQSVDRVGKHVLNQLWQKIKGRLTMIGSPRSSCGDNCFVHWRMRGQWCSG